MCRSISGKSILALMQFFSNYRITLTAHIASLTPDEFESWVDSSWTDVKPSQKSTNFHYITYNNAIVHWRSKVASILTTSTTEEIISVVSCSQDVAFCRKLTNEFGFMQTKHTVLWEDNNG